MAGQDDRRRGVGVGVGEMNWLKLVLWLLAASVFCLAVVVGAFWWGLGLRSGNWLAFLLSIALVSSAGVAVASLFYRRKRRSVKK